MLDINASRFVDNYAEHGDGGAVYVGGTGSTNSIHNSVFDNNHAIEGNGGAVEWVASAGNITYTNFTGNDAEYGGALHIGGSAHDTSIDHVWFENNTAVRNGGAMDSNATYVHLTYTTFKTNYAEFGAALCREIGATGGYGHDNVFIANHAYNAGAALAWLGAKAIQINKYTFINNTADVRGGAIFIDEGSDDCGIHNCTFEGNYITNITENHDGGAILCNARNTTIEDSSFTNNYAYNGGAIYVTSNVNSEITVILRSNFTDNYAASQGGAIGLRASAVTLNQTIFKDNTAYSGGAVFVGGEQVNYIYDSVFEENMAENKGGAIDWESSIGNIFDSNFTLNTANYGGALYLGGTSDNTIVHNVIFSQNVARENGGAIDCNASRMNLTDTLFDKNIAQYGAALCREGHSTGGFGYNNNFTNNHAYIGGAALAWMNASGIKIDNYIFINNTAGEHGGAIFVLDGSDSCKVYNSYFENNNVHDGHGGAIDWVGENGEIINSTFIRNSAEFAGAILVCDHAHNMLILNSSFEECQATKTSGGAIEVNANGTTIDGCNFTSCIAMTSGGSIAGLNSSNTKLSNLLFKYSLVYGSRDTHGVDHGEGGAIYWQDATGLDISKCEFLHNEARLEGGSISLNNCSSSSLSELVFDDDFAEDYGGSVCWYDSTDATIDSCEFKNCVANFNGGAIYLKNINATVSDSTFNNTRTALGTGGAIYANGNVTIKDSEFENCNALNREATSVVLDGGISTIENSNFACVNPILITNGTNASLTKNNVKNITSGTYSVWNDGDLYLDDNTFNGMPIYNNNTIWTETHTDMLDNKTWEAEWNSMFEFWANITDDNKNPIVSVRTLMAYNTEHAGTINYSMPYNKVTEKLIHQGVYHIYGIDSGLKNNIVRPGTLKVKATTHLEFDVSNSTYEYDRFIITSPDGGKHIVVKAIIYDQTEFHNVSGSVTFRVNGAEYVTAPIIDGIATAVLELNNIKAGTYTISASYSGDDNYFPCENNSIIIVNLRPNFINISIDNAYYGHMIVANVTTAGNGTIVLYINGKNKTYDLRYTHGLIYITNEFGDLKPGNWSVGVVYNEDEYFKYAINQTVFEVYKIDTPIEANATNITYGENEIINVTVDESATGYIAVRVGTDIHVLPVVNGTAKFNISGLAAGNYTALVVYAGDAIYNNATTTVSFKVGPTENYILDVKVDDIEYGQNATIRVLVPVLSGNVTINVDGKIIETVNVTNGTATLDVSGLAGGVHFVNVTYNGNEAFAPKDKNGTNFTVKPTTDWKMNITMTEPAIYGENTTIFISGLPDSAKNVTLRIDNINYTVNVTAGKANLTLNNLSVGVHPAVAIYEGDANYSYKEQIFRPHIIKATPTITLTEINGDVIATVSGNTTGNVTFYVNGKEHTVNLTGRTVKLTADKLNIGINNIVAVYNGDANYTEARTTGNFTVDRLVSLVNVTANDTAYGKPVTVTVKVGKNQTGFVTIYVNGEEHSAKIKNQTATFTLRGLDIGRYRINVTYEGDNTFDVENNYTYFNVTKADLDVSVIAQNVTVKDNASFIIIVPADFDGKVNITVDNKTYTRDLINPVEIAKLLAGNKNATLLFYNSTKYADKKINVTFTVTRADPTINVRINDTTYPNKAVAEITVSDMANGTVKVIIGTQEFTGNVVNGTARVDLTGLSAGVKVADVRFTTTDDYNNNATAKASFTVLRANGTVVINGVGNVTYEIGSVFTINATTNSTGMINIIVNGKSYAVLNNTNIALDSGKLAAGHYIVTAVVNETENYTKAIATVEFTIVKHAAVIDYVEVPKVNVTVGESVTVTVHMANVTRGSVLIEIGEHNYTVDIVNNYAVLTVKLPVGTYNATAYYLGDANYTGDVKHNATLFNVTDKKVAWVNITDVCDIVVDSNITFQVTTNSNATLVVKVNGVEATYLGYGKYTFNGTAAGNYTITAEVKANEYYTAAFNTTMFKVVKHNSTIHVDEISNHLVGDDFEITVSKNNTAFTVTINGVEYNVTKGVVKIDTTKLPAGQYIVTAIVKESDKYYGNSSTARFNITKNKSSVDVTTKDIKVGETARINITGPKDFNGTAIVNINGSSYNVVLTNGVGFVEVSNLANGTYNINVTYVENEKYLSSFNDSAVLNVSKWDKDSFDFTVRVVQNITAGQSAVLNITLPADATGNVTVKVAGINKTFAVMGGTNEIVIVGIPVGEYDVNVTYNGNEKYMPANASDKINVAPEIPTGFKVVDLRNGTVVVTVPANATGNITLKIGDHIYNATIVNSTAIINLNETPGIYYANVTYSGDEKHAM